MAEHSGMSKAEEQSATRRRAEGDSPAQHGAEASYLTTLLRHANLRGRGSSGTRAQALLNMQRTHGNRAVQRALSTRGSGQIAVQRDDYSPSLPPFLMGPATMGFDYLLHSLGPSSLPPMRDPAQPTVSEMVQEQIARAQGAKAFHEGQQAKQHDQAIDDAQRAVTGLPPDWFTWGKDPPGPLEQPQYEDVSPALNPWELQELQRENEFLEARR
ncbi:MAG TPA: hypothetical protein VJ183_18430 [Chloroflexia bacterium]|nr:hypothetical protein [Chloroflexia bacterium]